MAKKRNKPLPKPASSGMPPIEPEPDLVKPQPTTYEAPTSPQTEATTMSTPASRERTTQEQYGKYVPSRKWGVSTVGGIGSVLIMWATTGTFDTEETVAAITLAVTALTVYLTPNASGNPNEPSHF